MDAEMKDWIAGSAVGKPKNPGHLVKKNEADVDTDVVKALQSALGLTGDLGPDSWPVSWR